MNVAELKALIKDLPDNLPVRVEHENAYGNEPIDVPVTDTHIERNALYIVAIV